jgi:hypothetical protein
MMFRSASQSPLTSGASCVRVHANSLCVAHSNGSVTLRDLRTFNTQQILQLHAGGVSDITIGGDLMASVGWSKGRR